MTDSNRNMDDEGFIPVGADEKPVGRCLVKNGANYAAAYWDDATHIWKYPGTQEQIYFTPTHYAERDNA